MITAIEAKNKADKYYELENILKLIEETSLQGEYQISLPSSYVSGYVRSELTKLGFYWASSSSINIRWDEPKEAQ